MPRRPRSELTKEEESTLSAFENKLRDYFKRMNLDETQEQQPPGSVLDRSPETRSSES